MKKKILTALALIAFGVLGRLVPHVPNATPITALAVMGARHVGPRASLALPLMAMLLADLVIGFYDWRILLSVYGSFLAIAALNLAMRRFERFLPAGTVLIAASLLFFLVTNFAVWFFSPWYAKTFVGLLSAYALGLPFLRNMLLGDIAYTALLALVLERAPEFFKKLERSRGYAADFRPL